MTATRRPTTGWICAAGGLIGVASGLVTAFATFGLLLLAGCEIWGLRLTNAFVDGPQSGPLGMTYGYATIASGIGLTLAGVSVVRTRRWRGWARWTPLVRGILVFAMVVPGVSGTFVECRLTTTAWMIVWSAIGVALILDPPATNRRK